MNVSVKNSLFATAFVVIATLLLLCGLEISAYAARWILRKPTVPLFYLQTGGARCSERMLFDPHLGYTHNNDGTCYVRDGYARESFVYYLPPALQNDGNIRIVTLGGSTTDGFYQNYADGFTWPLIFSSLCNKDFKQGCDVINGAVAGYGSSKEYMKFVRDIVRMRPRPHVIISLNGDNDVLGYNTSRTDHLIHPYFDKYQLTMLEAQKFPILNMTGVSIYFPNIYFSLLKRGLLPETAIVEIGQASDSDSSLLAGTAYDTSIPKASYRSSWEVWRDNVEMMHNFAESVGIKYYVFLQPTMGIRGETPPPPNSHDAAVRAQVSERYVAIYSDAFDGMKRECATLPFCYDITAVGPPTGDLYYDPRHYNEKGNRILAEEIYVRVKDKLWSAPE